MQPSLAMWPCFCSQEMKCSITLSPQIPLSFSSAICTQGKQQGRKVDSFKNKGVSKDAFQYNPTELRDLVRYLPNFHTRVTQLSLWSMCSHVTLILNTG